MDILEKLLDEESDGIITLTNEDGDEMVFNQVAVIPYEDKIYAILAPLSEMEDVSDDEAIVFLVDELEDGEHVLVLERDEPTAMAVFDEYIKLWEDSQAEEEYDGDDN